MHRVVLKLFLLQLIFFEMPLKCQFQSGGKKLKFILDGFEPTFDSDVVADFSLYSAKGSLYKWVIVKNITALFIDVRVTTRKKGIELYKLHNLDGCMFLENTLFNRMFKDFYEKMLVNTNAPMKCPVRASTYFLRSEINSGAFPPIHPKGLYVFELIFKTNTFDAVILGLKWKYRFIKEK